MLLNCGVGEDSWASLGLQGGPTSPIQRKSVLSVHWKDLCWSWNFNILATWCEELTLLKRPWCWERLKAGGEGDDRRWDDWNASPTQCTWVWVNSGSWWYTGRPGVLQSLGGKESDTTEGLNWAKLNLPLSALWWMRLRVCVSFLIEGTGGGKIWVLLWWAGRWSVKL